MSRRLRTNNLGLCPIYSCITHGENTGIRGERTEQFGSITGPVPRSKLVIRGHQGDGQLARETKRIFRYAAYVESDSAVTVQQNDWRKLPRATLVDRYDEFPETPVPTTRKGAGQNVWKYVARLRQAVRFEIGLLVRLELAVWAIDSAAVKTRPAKYFTHATNNVP